MESAEEDGQRVPKTIEVEVVRPHSHCSTAVLPLSRILFDCTGISQASCRTSCVPFPQGIPHVALGEVAERSEDGEGRNVKKTCQWHIFSVDLSGYAAVASILVCTASSFSSDLGSYAAVASIRTYTALSWIPSQSPTVTALPKGEPRVCTPPLPHTINKRRITPHGSYRPL